MTSRAGPAIGPAIVGAGLFCGRWASTISLSDGGELFLECGGFLNDYAVDSADEITESIKRWTCELCLPNFQARIDYDQAHGLLKTSDPT